MKACLMYEDRDVDPSAPLPLNEDDVVQDLELDTLLAAMSKGDRFVLAVSRRALLTSLEDPDAIRYRQAVLADCLEQPSTVRGLYELAVDAVQAERRIWGIFSASPDSILYRSTQVMRTFVEFLRRLRDVSEADGAKFHSAGFVRFFGMLSKELDDEFLESVEVQLRELAFRGGVLISAELGPGNTGSNYVLRLPRGRRWFERIAPRSLSGYSFEVPARDEGGMRAISELRGRGVNLVANALAQSAEHIRDFFEMLATELAFYVGCMHLYDQLAGGDGAVCNPIVVASDRPELSTRGLYDVSLSLRLGRPVVGNDIAADGQRLIMITGANQGGKSTLMRAVGQAQLMMQCGMFVCGDEFRADVRSGVFTHYKREEDPSMQSGKFEEELGRMRDIAAYATPRSLLLLNESFAATNEREGSEIARQVIRAFIDAGHKVVVVTHLYDLADGFYREASDTALFLRAERMPDGGRTFKVREGKPLSTSFGPDTYQRVFGGDGHFSKLPISSVRPTEASQRDGSGG
jgi:hypothetical protein